MRRARGVRGDIRHPVFDRAVTLSPRTRRARPIIDRPTLGLYLIAAGGRGSTLPTVAGRHGFGGAIGSRSPVGIAKPGRPVLRRALVWRQFRSVLFLWLAGLADGLVPKERHYAQSAISPTKFGSPASSRAASSKHAVEFSIYGCAPNRTSDCGQSACQLAAWASPCGASERRE